MANDKAEPELEHDLRVVKAAVLPGTKRSPAKAIDDAATGGGGRGFGVDERAEQEEVAPQLETER